MKLARLEELRESSILLAQAPPAFARATLYGFVLLLMGLFAWAWMAKVPVIVRAEGRIRPTGRVWPVDAEVGGRVIAVETDENRRVEKGALLLKLDPAPVELEIKGIERELDSCRPERTELDRMAFLLARYERGRETPLEGLDRYRERFSSWIRELELEGINIRRKEEELKRLEGIGEKIVAAAELSNARLTLQESQSTYLVTLARHRAEVERDLQAARQKLEALGIQLEQRRDQLKRLDIRAPVRGIVTSMSVRHMGQVVKSGQELFQISPDGEKLVAEVWVPAHQAGFVTAGLPARIEVSTFPESVFGWIPGTVLSVSPDASGPSGEGVGRESFGPPLYRVEVGLSRETLMARDGRVGSIRLGLQTTARLVVRQERLLLHALGIVRDVFASTM